MGSDGFLIENFFGSLVQSEFKWTVDRILGDGDRRPTINHHSEKGSFDHKLLTVALSNFE
ncbi:MAG: hypothetical protein AAFY26_16655 [Cyanobacteria bacterium J06638_22]